MKKTIKGRSLLLVFIFVLGIIFNPAVQIAKAEDTSPVLAGSGNTADFYQGQTAVNVDSNISLTGDTNIDGAQIYIGEGFIQGEDSLLFTNQNNITGVYNPNTGVLTLAGVDSTANYQAALRSIKYSNSSSNIITSQRKIIFSIGGKVLYCPSTGHYYEYVANSCSWDIAKANAEGKSYYGLKGYLVTITSQEENDFVQKKIAGNTWIGASDADPDVLGHWTWRTGPEAGDCFWNRPTTSGSQSKTAVDGNKTYNDMYNNWDIGEPNNYNNTNERYAHMYSSTGLWNDFKINDTNISGYVVEYSEATPTLKLTAQVTLNVFHNVMPSITAVPQSDGNYVNLSWNPNDTSQTYHYMVTKKDINSGEAQGQTIPLKDTAKVLNIYPGGGTIITGKKDLDGLDLDKSGNAKLLEETFGKNKITVDSVYIVNFSADPDKYLKDENGKYKYDVVFVGSWDSNNNMDITPGAKTAIQNFIDAGGGYLAGHDTTQNSDRPNLSSLAVGNINIDCNSGYGLYGGGSGEIYISITKKGSLTNYPWELSSSTLLVPASHTTFQFAKGYVWMKYDSNTMGGSLYDKSIDTNLTGTNNFYLTTWNNTAIIQTGHSNGAATEDEQKILVNTLLYLSQVSTDTSFADHTAQDVTPPAAVSDVSVNVNADKSSSLTFTKPADNGNTYEYQLKAIGDTDKKVYVSNKTSATVTSGIKGYAVVVDQNSDTDPGKVVNTTECSFSTSALSNGTWYAHINAIDNAGNVSSTTTKTFTVAPAAPILQADKTTTTYENVTVTIKYSDDSTVKKYSKDGGATWSDYTAPIVMISNGTIQAKGQDASGNWSQIGSITVSNIHSIPSGNTGSSTRTVPVVIEGSNVAPVAVDITRTTSENGEKKDTVIYTKEKAEETLQKARDTGKDTAVILITDIKGDEAKEVVVKVPQVSMDEMGSNGMGLNINSPKAVVELPKETMEKLKDKEISIQMKEVDQVTEQKSNQLVLQFAAGSDLITKPLVIETNFSERTKITVPFRNVDMPKTKQELDKFLSGLSVMVQHSDGENIIDKGTIEYDKDGNPVGISIWVDKFSTFTIVELPEKLANFDGETYVIDQKVSLGKEWAIEFSRNADEGTVTDQSIYVLDSKGEIYKTKLTTSGNVVKVKAVENYKANETYYLYVTKKVKSKTGKLLTKAVRYKFGTDK